VNNDLKTITCLNYPAIISQLRRCSHKTAPQSGMNFRRSRMHRLEAHGISPAQMYWRHIMKTVLAAVAALTMTVAAHAQTADFATADADGNGTVSMEELKAVMPDISEDKVTAADKNGDGQLDEEEYNALISM
jgi:hypothetical protein